MTFEPTTRDMEMIASLSTRGARSRIAAALGISEDEFAAFAAPVAMGADTSSPWQYRQGRRQ